MEYNSSVGYKIVKAEVQKFLNEFDFKQHGSSTSYRITSDNILQFINFQKGERSLNQQMIINVVLQGLFSPTCSFDLLQPGGRLGRFSEDGLDKWWFCNTNELTEVSLIQIKDSIKRCLLPFFEKTSFANQVCIMINNSEYNFIWENNYTFIDKGFFYLKAKRYEEALAIFESKQPSKVSKFKTIKSSIAQKNFEAIESILMENQNHAKSKLKI